MGWNSNSPKLNACLASGHLKNLYGRSVESTLTLEFQYSQRERKWLAQSELIRDPWIHSMGTSNAQWDWVIEGIQALTWMGGKQTRRPSAHGTIEIVRRIRSIRVQGLPEQSSISLYFLTDLGWRVTALGAQLKNKNLSLESVQGMGSTECSFGSRTSFEADLQSSIGGLSLPTPSAMDSP